MLQKIMHKLLPLLLLLMMIILLPRNSASLQFPSSRRNLFIKSATAATAASCFCCTGGGVEVANAAIDVSGLKVEQSSSSTITTTPGRAPNQPSSGPLAGTSLGFQVGGGPRSED